METSSTHRPAPWGPMKRSNKDWGKGICSSRETTRWAGRKSSTCTLYTEHNAISNSISWGRAVYMNQFLWIVCLFFSTNNCSCQSRITRIQPTTIIHFTLQDKCIYNIKWHTLKHKNNKNEPSVLSCFPIFPCFMAFYISAKWTRETYWTLEPLCLKHRSYCSCKKSG